MADLQHAFVGEQRLEARDDLCERKLGQLLGEHALAALMADRDIAGTARRGGEADADEIGDDAVQRIGLGVDGDDAAGEGFGDPGVELLDGGDGLVAVEIDGRERHQRLGRRLACGRRRGGCIGAIGGRRGGCPNEARHQRLEALVLQELAQRLGRDGIEPKIVEAALQRHLPVQLNQLARQPRHVGMLDEIVAHLGRLHRGGGGEHALQVAIFEDQLAGGLGTDAGNAGHIVDRVAHQGEHVAQPVGLHAELVDDIARAAPLVLHRVEHVDAGLDELGEILVG